MVPDLVPCPICKKAARYRGNPFRPFCSERCKKIDLGEWAAEGYVVAGRSSEIDEDNVSTTVKTPQDGGEVE